VPTSLRNWSLTACLPEDPVDDILALPFEAPSLDGLSGKRELHNNTRNVVPQHLRKCRKVARRRVRKLGVRGSA
jgi:hypothetical protein